MSSPFIPKGITLKLTEEAEEAADKLDNKLTEKMSIKAKQLIQENTNRAQGQWQALLQL